MWQQFVAGQWRCYERFGVAGASAEVDATGGDVWCVVALRGDAPVAGARLLVKTPGRPLPLEGLLGAHPALAQGCRARRAEGVAEVGGLWATEDLAGTGIGGPVIAAAVACAAAIPVRHLVSFAHHHNRFTRAVGFEPDARLGVHPYPDERYRSTVNWCDALDPVTAEPFVQRTIRRWRRHAVAGVALPFDLFALEKEEDRFGDSNRQDASHEARARMGQPLVIGSDLQLVESTRPPDDARDLLGRGPRPCAALPEGARGTTVALRGGDGHLLAVATVVAAEASPLAASLPAASLRRSAWLADFSWRAGAARAARLLLYAAARRARSSATRR